MTWVNIFQIITLSYIVYLMENTKFNYDNASGCITSKATDSDMYPSCYELGNCKNALTDDFFNFLCNEYHCIEGSLRVLMVTLSLFGSKY